MRPYQQFFAELKRRKVFRVMAVYGVIGFGVIEVAQAIFPHVGLPEAAVTFVVWLVLLGFPIALVLTWAFETSPDGRIRRTPPVQREVLDDIVAQPASRRWPIGLAGAVGGGLLVAAAWLAIDDGGEALVDVSAAEPPAETLAADADPGVAVLPFRFTGADSVVWQTDIANLLSFNIDEVPGLRKIDPATVLSQWDRAIPTPGTPDSLTASAVARATGARYAVTGSVLEVGRGGAVRVRARVYDVAENSYRGTVEVDGVADSLISLIDGLAAEILRHDLLPVGGAQPFVNLAGVTTPSLPALKAYLEGEARYRAGSYEEAIGHYLAAIEHDSAFARAYYRLASAYSWTNMWGLEARARARAAELADRLSGRDAELISLALAPIENIEELEIYTRKYPDDPDGWFAYGDAVFHQQGKYLLPPEKYRSAFEAAVAMAPHYHEAYIHLLDDAAARLDRGRVADIVEAYDSLGDENPCPGVELLYDVRWGSADARRSATAAIDSLPYEAVGCLWSALAVTDPTMERAEREELGMDEIPGFLFWRMAGARFFNGQTGDVARILAVAAEDARYRGLEAGYHVLMHVSGYRDSVGLSRHVESLRSEPINPSLEPGRGAYLVNHFWRGALALHRGRDAEVRAAVNAIDSIATNLRASEPRRAETMAAYGTALREFTRIRTGDFSRLDAFQAAMRNLTTESTTREYPGYYLRLEVGKILLEAGRLREAEVYLRSLYPYAFPYFVPAQFNLGRVYEALGEREKARDHYRIVAEWWEDADPRLQPQREQALEALRRLAPDS